MPRLAEAVAGVFENPDVERARADAVSRARSLNLGPAQVESMLEALPDRMPDWEVVLSTTTMQGYQVARTEQPDILTFYYPLDFSLVTYRALRRIRPHFRWPRVMPIIVWFSR